MATITQPATLPSQGTTTFPWPTTTSYATCTWPGHCLGAACSSNDDCDNDWICINQTCSPCCEDDYSTLSPTTPLPTPTNNAGTKAPAKKLSTGAAVGIGVGAAVAVILIVAAILWFWRARRRKSMMDRPTELETTPSRLPASYDEGAGVDVYKREAGPPGELPVPPPKPSELESRQLAELEGNSKGMR